MHHHSGRRKRSFPSQAAAQQVCDRQKDPGLLVYECEAGQGWHLGHRHTNLVTGNHTVVNAKVSSMSPNPLHKEFSMQMRATLANPILITLYSAALLLIGCGVGVRFHHSLPTALWICGAASILVAVHDLATGFLWFWLTAKWVRSMMIQRDRRG
jgi:hypothetical protein